MKRSKTLELSRKRQRESAPQQQCKKIQILMLRSSRAQRLKESKISSQRSLTKNPLKQKFSLRTSTPAITTNQLNPSPLQPLNKIESQNLKISHRHTQSMRNLKRTTHFQTNPQKVYTRVKTRNKIPLIYDFGNKKISFSRSQEHLPSRSPLTCNKEFYATHNRNERVSYMSIKEKLPIITVKFRKIVKEDQKRVFIKNKRSLSMNNFMSYRSEIKNAPRVNLQKFNRFVSPSHQNSSRFDTFYHSESIQEKFTSTQESKQKIFCLENSEKKIPENEEKMSPRVFKRKKSLKEFLDENCFYKQAQKKLSNLNQELTESIKNSENIFEKAMQYLTPTANPKTTQKKSEISTDTHEKNIEKKKGNYEEIKNTVELSFDCDNFKEEDSSLNFTPIFRMMNEESVQQEIESCGDDEVMLIEDFENECFNQNIGTKKTIDFCEDEEESFSERKQKIQVNYSNFKIPNYTSSIEPNGGGKRIRIDSKSKKIMETLDPKKRHLSPRPNVPNKPSEKFKIVCNGEKKEKEKKIRKEKKFEFSESIKKVHIEQAKDPKKFLESFLDNIDTEIATINHKISGIVDVLQEEENKENFDTGNYSTELARNAPKRSPSPKKFIYNKKEKRISNSSRINKVFRPKDSLKTIKINLDDIKKYVNSEEKSIKKKKKLRKKIEKSYEKGFKKYSKINFQKSQTTLQRSSYRPFELGNQSDRFTVKNQSIVPNLGHPGKSFKPSYAFDLRSRSLTERNIPSKKIDLEKIFKKKKSSKNFNFFKNSLIKKKFTDDNFKGDVKKKSGRKISEQRKKKKLFSTKRFQVRQENWFKNKQKKLQGSRVNKELEEVKDCTFKPKIKKTRFSKKSRISERNVKNSEKIQ